MRAESSTYGKKHIRKIYGDAPGHKVVADVVNRRMDPEQAFKQLSTMTAEYKVFAGHVALQLARRASAASETTDGIHWLAMASDAYTRAKAESKVGGEADKLVGVRAQLGLTHLQTQACLLVNRCLPEPALAQSHFAQVIDAGKTLEQLRTRYVAAGKAQLAADTRGLLSEVALFALADRFAIRKIGSDSWFAFPAFLSEDRANNKGSVLSRSWDMTIATAVDGEVPEDTYRVQIKSSKDGITKFPDDAPGIARINVFPDLALDESENATVIAQRIINGCDREQDSGSSHYFKTRALDQRTDKFLEKIDS